MRKVIAVIEVNDEKAIIEDMGTIEYLEREFGWIEGSGIFLSNTRILDDDDIADVKAIDTVNKIFMGEI